METVFVITRTCTGEDYSEPSTDIEIFGTLEKAKRRFKALIKEESEYLDNEDLADEIIESKDSWELDYIDYDADYRVIVTLKKGKVK